ncbi:enterobactin synthase subunit EntD [Raoultella planticola]|uniref:enterobactin synthase subunit EntD n=1 Tax=Raoultella planticola TaxID=575 RepID=UPI0021AFCF93|nr:enterobactin synthase subunit EntD [Raoultella planticola]MCS7490150.1 enterobactin synthase subunit EntD [Raoultella planticola]MDC3909455.1 enterobactin synthase subunit EntD [Raoultella planticola]
MQTTHSTFLFAGHRLHQIDFDPATFAPHDILWLPHHQQLENCGRKRQMEHLAGRIAAACALKAVGVKGVPGTGDQRQPLCPVPWSGSISHCDTRALAVVASRPVGIDIENVLTPALATELESSIISPTERAVLKASGLPFELALTLAFSAKESGFKALPLTQQSGTGFMHFRITDIQGEVVTLWTEQQMYQVHWMAVEPCVITLCQTQHR